MSVVMHSCHLQRQMTSTVLQYSMICGPCSTLTPWVGHQLQAKTSQTTQAGVSEPLSLAYVLTMGYQKQRLFEYSDHRCGTPHF